MPRRPRVRARSSGTGGTAGSSSSARGSTPRRAARAPRGEPPIFWQCQACGAPVEPQFGAGDDSWCPACHAVGTVVGMEGQYPSPALYGAWAARQAREQERARVQAELTASMPHHHPLTTKEELMKRTKTHTGTFHCPTCFTEVELVNEESLKCDRCKGPLAAGSLDEIWTDGDEDDD